MSDGAIGGVGGVRAGSEVRNLDDALDGVTDHWAPVRLASLNDHDVKIVKVRGEFVWHTHPETDELFLVRDGRLTIMLRAAVDSGSADTRVELGPGDVFVVPRGVEHCPRADDEVSAVIIEKRGTVNTGDAGGPMTSILRELPPT